MDTTDWRLQGQEKYLLEAILYFKKYSDRKIATDHNYCEFCWGKFSDSRPGFLEQGYTTANDYRWICENYYSDFKEYFKFRNI